VHVFLHDATYAVLTDTGVRLIDAALSWAVNRELTLPSDPPLINPPTIVGGNITITWEQGGELETSSTISSGWSGTGNSTGSFTGPVGDGARFYRIRRAP
jgi:hypothetical protein